MGNVVLFRYKIENTENSHPVKLPEYFFVKFCVRNDVRKVLGKFIVRMGNIDLFKCKIFGKNLKKQKCKRCETAKIQQCKKGGLSLIFR